MPRPTTVAAKLSHLRALAATHGIPVYLIRPGDEDASWLAARPVFERFIDGHDCADALLYS